MKTKEDLILEDLSKYHQDKHPPKSITFGKGDDRRHYEFGECSALVAYIIPDVNDISIIIRTIHEDDEFYYLDTEGFKRYGEDLTNYIDLFSRMKQWITNNFIIVNECPYKIRYKNK